ncbi:ABC transporter substrate-binding protein [Paenibacillus sp. y28]|uniref:ABC transporter substrate-binding protein n=1 Tax=Paenibacillus sp. y28 TaxID=3129110 RepID=UPI003015D34D
MKLKRNVSFMVAMVMTIILLAACSPGGGSSETGANTGSAAGESGSGQVELRMMWWGAQARHDATLKVIELFEKQNPNIKIVGEYMGSDGYFDKLNTQVAGGNAPDLIQLGNNFPDYVTKNALLDLTPYMGKEINVADFEKSSIESGGMDGKQYGIVLGSNAYGIAYNTELIKKAGMQPPTGDWTWEEFGKYAAELTQKLGKGYYGAVDESRLPLYLNYFARQSNKTLYKDGKVGLGKEEIANWFTMWDNFRKAGSTPPADITAAYTEAPENSSFVEGKTAMHLVWSNQINAYQKAMKDEIKVVLPPKGGAGSAQGLWLQPSQFMTVNSKTKYPKEAAKFISFMVNDPEATKILGSERGVPGSSKAREALKANASEVDKKVYGYIDIAAKNSRSPDREIPNGKAFESTLVNMSQKVAFGKATISEAADEVLSIAGKVIKQ